MIAEDGEDAMLTLTQVRGFVNNSAYFARGRVYAQEGRVGDIRREADASGAVRLAARVDGVGGTYDVAARFDEQALLECACSCPAFARTGAMCKHVAALLIADCLENREQDKQTREEAARRETARLEQERREQQAQQEKALFLQMLLHGEARRRRDAIRLCHEAAGDVRLYPVLIAEAGAAYLELKIGRARPYVVRSLAQFGQCAQRRGIEVYGRELTFSHTEEELHPDDAALYRCIVQLCDAAEGRSARLALEGARLDALMRQLLGREVEMRVDGQMAQPARVVEGTGSLTGQLTPRGEGYLLSLSARRAVCGARGAYFFDVEAGEIRCALGRAFSPLAPLFELSQRYAQGVQLDKAQLEAVAAGLLVPAGAALEMTKGREILLGLTPMAMRPQFLIDIQGRGRLTCEVRCDYGALTLAPGEDNPHIRRDALAEEEAMLCARRLFPKEDAPGLYAFEGKEDAVFELLSERLTELKRDGEVLIAERLRQLNVQKRRAMTFGLTREGEGLLVKADLGGLTEPELEAAYAAYRQKKKYILLEDGTFLSGEALEQAAQAAQVAKGLNLTAEELAAGANVPMNRALYLEAALADREEMTLSAPGEVENFIRRLSAARTAQAEPPETLRATLRPYQLTGYHWLCALRDAGFGGILADDMGLGKTLQALALLLREKEMGRPLRALVVCPASLQLNWLSEAGRFTPTLRCEAMTGSAQKRRELLAREEAPELTIVSYDQLRRDVQAYHGQTFTHVLLDEAQNIKNAASQGAKAVKAIDCGFRLAMTGTPIENRLSELWSIFDFLMPGYLLSYKRFKERFEAPIVQENDEQAQQNLRLLTAPFILRRMKRDVLTDLPEKVETLVRSEMTPEQRKLYAAYAAKLAGEIDTANAAANRMQMLAGLTRLRQICCDPQLCFEDYAGGSGKLEQCMELIQNAVQAGHEILLFSQFTSMLAILRAQLEGEGMTVFTLTGDTDKQERMRLVEAFNAGEADVFLISLKAGGTGLNLTGADVVIHYDPWWNTAAQNQATDRAYRIGQTRGVQVFKLIASESIEERIVRLQEAKAELAGGLLESDEPLGVLDEKTMRELLL